MPLEGHRELRSLLDPSRKPDEKQSTITLNPFEVWLYLASPLQTEPSETRPSPKAVIERVANLLETHIDNTRNLPSLCRGYENLARNIVDALKLSAENIKSLQDRAPDIYPGIDEESFVSTISTAKGLAKEVGGVLLSLTSKLSRYCRTCNKSRAPHKCCERCRELGTSIAEIPYYATPLLDTCYDSNESLRIYRAVKSLYEHSERIKAGLGYKALAIVLSIAALEVTEGLEPALEWASDLVKARIGLRRWLWKDDLAMLVYTIQAVTGLQKVATLSREELASILRALASL